MVLIQNRVLIIRSACREAAVIYSSKPVVRVTEIHAAACVCEQEPCCSGRVQPRPTSLQAVTMETTRCQQREDGDGNVREEEETDKKREKEIMSVCYRKADQNRSATALRPGSV